jgi:hypothetical protein
MSELIFLIIGLNLLLIIAMLSHKLYILKDKYKKENLYNDNNDIFTRPN